jgi:alpha-amylase
VIAEGWEKYLDWRSPNYVYESVTETLPETTKKLLDKYRVSSAPNDIKLLLKNYKLSDDIAFRFSNKEWEEYPLTADKFLTWIEESPGDVINLFMDYETFGEHQWEDTGIYDFMEKFAKKGVERGFEFITISEASNNLSVHDEISYPELTSWADTERDLTAWIGNKLQKFALQKIYEIENEMGRLHPSSELVGLWRRLQTSDHFYYMSTKFWNDGDVHAYFSPYESPYEAFINYMNILEDFSKKLDYQIAQNAQKNKL